MRITESQLRRIIRQEVRALREGPSGPDRLVYKSGYDPAADFKATQGMTPRQIDQYWKNKNAELLKKQRAAASAVRGQPAPNGRLARAPQVTGGSAKLRPVAQSALNSLYGGDDPMDVVQFVVNQTAKYEPGYEPTGGFSDFSYIVGDKASEVIAIIRKVDPGAADELEEALTEVYY